jgi:hypothetical protein
MKIEILGTGCYNCIKLETLINEVLQELNISGVRVTRINDEKIIRSYMPLDEIPGLVIDGHLISTQIVPERSVLLNWFQGVKQTTG